MVLVDSSVWIDHFRNDVTAQVARLRDLLDIELIWLGDLVMVEVLQGCDTERDMELVARQFAELACIDIGGFDVATDAALHFRKLRGLGITVRKTIDTLIATRCIRDTIPLLYSDRDFDPFVRHLGLKDAMIA
jgi:predicted nucleic acid-binding protein